MIFQYLVSYHFFGGQKMRYNFYPPKFFETFLWPNVIYMEGIPRALE